MTDAGQELIWAFETHDVEGVRGIIASGLDVGEPIRGKRATTWLTEMYTRSDRFPDCLQVLMDHGAQLEDPVLLPVLMNDPATLRAALQADPALMHHRTTMNAAFTPLSDASLLHVAAEYGFPDVVRVLVEEGADVNLAAGTDEHGLNGHTPIFHTVNSHANRSRPIMDMLLDAGASPDIRLQGITWGQSFEWETTCFDVTPISYAQLGLLPQMHRSERDVYANVERLLQASGRSVPPLENVPNQYVASSR